MSSPSDETKQKRGYGTGHGADYKPWISTGRFSSTGTASSFPDWKTGRMVELLSQGELWWYIKLRWCDSVADIREQYPLLPREETNEIADKLGIKRPKGGNFTMTTNMLIDLEDGRKLALSIKPSADSITPRKKELMAIEKKYWQERGVSFSVAFKDDLNREEIKNIRDCITVYDKSRIRDEIGVVRHLIAHKKLIVDMSSPIDYRGIITKLKEDNKWILMTSTLTSPSELC